MTKYRIISKPSFLRPEDPDFRWYQAQYKFLNLFWVDCGEEYNAPGTAYSMKLEYVERFVQGKINNERIDLSTKVVKVYE
jgi:hypothetical protein